MTFGFIRRSCTAPSAFAKDIHCLPCSISKVVWDHPYVAGSWLYTQISPGTSSVRQRPRQSLDCAMRYHAHGRASAGDEQLTPGCHDEEVFQQQHSKKQEAAHWSNVLDTGGSPDWNCNMVSETVEQVGLIEQGSARKRRPQRHSWESAAVSFRGSPGRREKRRLKTVPCCALAQSAFAGCELESSRFREQY